MSPIIDWDPDQRLVIEAKREDRLIVEAGPGTGKTAVACARLAFLIENEDLEPSNTWMISFTRAAVAEIRARLHSYIGDSAFGVKVATLDAQAWSIHSGFDANAKLTGSYEENIKHVVELIRTDEDVTDELLRVEHLVIDEAQDLVNERATLLEKLINKLSKDCGVTIFSDEAQAIYDFTERVDDGRESSSGPRASIVDTLRSDISLGFETLELKAIHRTSSKGLKKIFSELRARLLDKATHKAGLCSDISEQIQCLADRQILTEGGNETTEYGSDDLVLFRSRAEALIAAQSYELPLRLRLAGYGPSLPAWLAICFYDWDIKKDGSRYIEKEGFLSLWKERVADNIAIGYGPNDAWQKLMKLAGQKDGVIDIKKLRRSLSRGRPPLELAHSEFGFQGPTIGTIHGSKGREAENVILTLSARSSFNDLEEEIEESRVLFVGATRARDQLAVCNARFFNHPKNKLESGRVHRSAGNGRHMVEVGRDGDITPCGLVGGKSLSVSEAIEAQAFLEKSSDIVTTYVLEIDRERDWCYRLKVADRGPCVAVLSKNLTNDLWQILADNNLNGFRRPPSLINHVRGQGSSTIVLGEDDINLDQLIEPWASSGFMLVPAIAAFPSFKFPHKRY